MYIDDLVILSILHFWDVRLRTSPHEVQRAYTFFAIISRCRHAGKAGTTITGEFGGGRVGGLSGTLGFSLERRG